MDKPACKIIWEDATSNCGFFSCGRVKGLGDKLWFCIGREITGDRTLTICPAHEIIATFDGSSNLPLKDDLWYKGETWAQNDAKQLALEHLKKYLKEANDD